MKNLPLIFMATLWGGIACSDLQASLDVELQVEAISDENATSHEFTVSYGVSLGVDPASLGDDDIIIGRGSLFDQQLGSAAFSPELVSVNEEIATDPIVATYRIDRPSEGWESWGLSRVGIAIAAGGVDDSEGLLARGHGLGDFIIELAAIPRMSIRVLEYPVIHPEDEVVRFRVLYQTNFPLAVEALGNGDISARRRGAVDDQFEFMGTLFTVPSWYVGPPLHASVAELEANDDKTTVTVDYNIDRPVDGWGDGDTMSLSLDRSKLGENNRTQPFIGSSGIARAVILREGSLVSVVKASDDVPFDEESITFEVAYTSAAGAIDISTLGDDDIGSYVVNFETGSRQVARLVEVVSEEDNGHKVTARYVLDRPAEGWLHIGGKQRLVLASMPEGVRTADGAFLQDADIGRFYFDSPVGDAAPYLIALDDWFRDLGDILGEEEPVTEETDHDNDGVKDVVEFILGGHPLDPSDAAPVSTEVVTNEGASYLQLYYDLRINARNVDVVLEGSTTGEEWLEVDDLFADVVGNGRVEEGIRSVTRRSAVPIANLPFRLFRLRVESTL